MHRDDIDHSQIICRFRMIQCTFCLRVPIRMPGQYREKINVAKYEKITKLKYLFVNVPTYFEGPCTPKKANHCLFKMKLNQRYKLSIEVADHSFKSDLILAKKVFSVDVMVGVPFENHVVILQTASQQEKNLDHCNKQCLPIPSTVMVKLI